MDEADTQVLEKIAAVLQENKSDCWINIHNLRLVKYGDTYHIDCDLTLPWYMNIADAHKQSDVIMKIISENLTNKLDFTIHTDACSNNLCEYCKMAECKHREQDFKTELNWTLDKLIKNENISLAQEHSATL